MRCGQVQPASCQATLPCPGKASHNDGWIVYVLMMAACLSLKFMGLRTPDQFVASDFTSFGPHQTWYQSPPTTCPAINMILGSEQRHLTLTVKSGS